MTPDANTIASVLGAVATGGFSVWAARSAKRTKRQENRDDFTEIKKALKEQAAELKADMAVQQDQITGQGAAIAWLVTDRRILVTYIRGAGLEPPLQRPIPERAKPYLDSIDV